MLYLPYEECGAPGESCDDIEYKTFKNTLVILEGLAYYIIRTQLGHLEYMHWFVFESYGRLASLLPTPPSSGIYSLLYDLKLSQSIS